MATVKDLFRRTQEIIDDTLANSTMVDWFNQCQDNIIDLLYLPTLVTIPRDVETGKFLMPTNCNGELKILSPEGIEYYSVYDDALYFAGEENTSLTEIQVTYNKMPTEITTDPTQVPSIHKNFHDVYVFYAAMMAMSAEEEPERYTMFETDFMRMRGQIQKYYGKLRPKPANWKVVR